MSDQPTRCGFAAIIGSPNAGKSTLTNALVGEKISIVTHKVQTTRFAVRGVALEGSSQIILVDTPGVFEPKRRLDKSMVAAAWSGADGAEVIVHVIDAGARARLEHGGAKSGEHRMKRYVLAQQAMNTIGNAHLFANKNLPGLWPKAC